MTPYAQYAVVDKQIRALQGSHLIPLERSPLPHCQAGLLRR